MGPCAVATLGHKKLHMGTAGSISRLASISLSFSFSGCCVVSVVLPLPPSPPSLNLCTTCQWEQMVNWCHHGPHSMIGKHFQKGVGIVHMKLMATAYGGSHCIAWDGSIISDNCAQGGVCGNTASDCTSRELFGCCHCTAIEVLHFSLLQWCHFLPFVFYALNVLFTQEQIAIQNGLESFLH